MKYKYNLRKKLTFAIILLFIGVSFSTVVSANLNKSTSDDDLIEIKIEFCGLDIIKTHNTKITKQESIEIENLIEETKNKLDNVVTIEEVNRILEESIFLLYKYDVFPEDTCVKDIQQLVIDSNKNEKKIISSVIEKNHILLNDNENMFCIIAGKSTNTLIIRPISFILAYLMNRSSSGDGLLNRLYSWAVQNEYWLLEGLLFFPLVFLKLFLAMGFAFCCALSYFIPTHILTSFFVGDRGTDNNPNFATGWINTYGLNGVKKWEGDFLGDIKIANSPLFNAYYLMGLGVVGFTGIKFFEFDGENIESFYLGHALWVKIEEA